MADNFVPDLDAYFARIGWRGARDEANLDTLNGITAHHAATIPFENLDVLAGKTICLSPEAVQLKLVHERRGGYCFEQNQLLLLVLRALGFQAQPLSARVRWLQPRDFTPPRTHLFVRVDLNGQSWITDCGVGGPSLTSALRWDNGLIQTTPHDQRRLIREEDVWLHQVRWNASSDWLDVCEFTGETMPPIDRELANWWTSAHPDSRFRNNLIVACSTLDGARRTLMNRSFAFRSRAEEPVKREVASRQELADLLRVEFGLMLPDEAKIEFLGFPT